MCFDVIHNKVKLYWGLLFLKQSVNNTKCLLVQMKKMETIDRIKLSESVRLDQ